MQIELPDTLNVYVKANNTTYPMDLTKMPVARVLHALDFGLKTMFGNARNGAGQGAGVAAITPFIEKKVAAQYTDIEVGSTARAVDPLTKEIKNLARAYALVWAKENNLTKDSPEYAAKVVEYAAKPKLIAKAQAIVAAKVSTLGLED